MKGPLDARPGAARPERRHDGSGTDKEGGDQRQKESEPMTRTITDDANQQSGSSPPMKNIQRKHRLMKIICASDTGQEVTVPVVVGTSSFPTKEECEAAFKSMTKTVHRIFHTLGSHEIGALPCPHGHHVVAWAIGDCPVKLVKKLHKKLEKWGSVNHDCDEAAQGIGRRYAAALQTALQGRDPRAVTH